MVYKKYIKKNGRLYGPYVYHSRRVNGKVVSEYHGSGGGISGNGGGFFGKVNGGKVLKGIFAFGLLVVLMGILFLGIKNYGGDFTGSTITGNIVQESQAAFYENQSLQSQVKFGLREGEFIPSDSRIVVEVESGTRYSYPLNELVDNEVKNGSYYIAGKNLDGSGEGYGVAGSGSSYVPLNFIVEVYETEEVLVDEPADQTVDVGVDSNVSENNGTIVEGNETVVDDGINGNESSVDAGTSGGNESSGSSGSSSSDSLGRSEASEETGAGQEAVDVGAEGEVGVGDGESVEVVDNSGADVVGGVVSEESVGDASSGIGDSGSSDSVADTIGGSEAVGSGSESTSDSRSGGVSGSDGGSSGERSLTGSGDSGSSGGSDSSGGGDSSSSDSGSDGASVTGAVVGSSGEAGLLTKIFGAFLGLFDRIGITGRATYETRTVKVSEVEGQIGSDGTWSYDFVEGRSVKLKEGSVNYNGSLIDNSYLDLEIVEGEVVVSSSYYEDSEGYGENYLGEDVVEEIVVNVTELEIPSEKGELKISLVYDERELISDVLFLENESEVVTSSNETDVPEVEVIVNETVNVTEQNVTVFNVTKLVLTEEELDLLRDKFGNVSLKTTKAEVVNGRIVLRYEIGDYWVEYSYDGESVGDLNKEELERDRVKWLKDLANKAKRDLVEEEPEEITELLEDVSIQLTLRLM